MINGRTGADICSDLWLAALKIHKKQKYISQRCKCAKVFSRPPNLRAHVERFIQTLNHECLDKFVIVAERHLNYICREWRLHYNRERPHEARGHLPPGMETPPASNETVRLNDIIYSSRLGGLLNDYWRAADFC